ncbi:MAG: hypothetical protein ACRDT0_01950, partial [Pseudonocardiaceae bacterium]
MPSTPRPSTPSVPTPLTEIDVRTGGGSGVPHAVLIGQSPGSDPASEADSDPIAGPGAVSLGVDVGWLRRHRVTGAAGSVTVVPLRTARPDHGWLVGTGAGSRRDWRAAGAALLRAADGRA